MLPPPAATARDTDLPSQRRFGPRLPVGRFPSLCRPRCFYCRRRPFCTVAIHRRSEGYPGVVNPIYCEAAGKREKEAPCTARWTICSAAVVIWEYDGGGCVHFLPAVFSSLPRRHATNATNVYVVHVGRCSDFGRCFFAVALVCNAFKVLFVFPTSRLISGDARKKYLIYGEI